MGVVDLSQKLEVMEEREVRAWTSVWAVEEGIPENLFSSAIMLVDAVIASMHTFVEVHTD